MDRLNQSIMPPLYWTIKSSQQRGCGQGQARVPHVLGVERKSLKVRAGGSGDPVTTHHPPGCHIKVRRRPQTLDLTVINALLLFNTFFLLSGYDCLGVPDTMVCPCRHFTKSENMTTFTRPAILNNTKSTNRNVGRHIITSWKCHGFHSWKPPVADSGLLNGG